jgi:hypothetical protein
VLHGTQQGLIVVAVCSSEPSDHVSVRCSAQVPGRARVGAVGHGSVANGWPAPEMFPVATQAAPYHTGIGACI